VAGLYRLHGPAVYRRCLRLLRNTDAARDATQEVFVKLVRGMDRLADRQTVLPWIYRVATNHCLNVRRNASRRGDGLEVPDLELFDAGGAAASPDRVLARELLERFDDATQAVAVGILVDGLEQEELATALGVSRRTVARKLERFLAAARGLLEESRP
jgi:RNA polymerase sigma-70 factor (ECF subfamily)